MTPGIKNSDPRSGTVLVMVVAVLAVLMVLAATFALTTRVELRISERYVADQSIRHLMDAVERYAVERLHEDRHDRDGDGFRPFDASRCFWVIDTGFEPVLVIDDGTASYDLDTLTDDDAEKEWPVNVLAGGWVRITGGDGEGQRRKIVSNTSDTLTVSGDWADTPGSGSYEITAARELLLKSAADAESIFSFDDHWIDAEAVFGDDYELFSRAERAGPVAARFLLHFEDLGGSRLDVNITGNTADAGNHLEGFGRTPFETRLAGLLHELLEGLYGDGKGGTVSALLVSECGYRDLDFPGSEPRYPDWPDGQLPFGAGSILDCVLAGVYEEFRETDMEPPLRITEYFEEDTPGSRLGEIIWGEMHQDHREDWARAARYLTAASAASVITDVVGFDELRGRFDDEEHFLHFFDWTGQFEIEDAGGGAFTLDGDRRNDIAGGDYITVRGSAEDDGVYEVDEVDFNAGYTTVRVSGTVSGEKPYGYLTARHSLVKRPLPLIVRNLTEALGDEDVYPDEPEEAVVLLSEFLCWLDDPEGDENFVMSAVPEDEPGVRRRIINQTALNIWNLLALVYGAKITGVDTGDNTFEISAVAGQDAEDLLGEGDLVIVQGSTGNDGLYVVKGVNGENEVTVRQDVGDATADGRMAVYYIHEWTDPDDGEIVYRGIPPGVPFIAEVAPVVNTALHPYVPASDGEGVRGSRRTADGENVAPFMRGEGALGTDYEGTIYFWYDLSWNGVDAPGYNPAAPILKFHPLDPDDWPGDPADMDVDDQDSPLSPPPYAGWGKYIKLVNPWAHDIVLWNEDFDDTYYRLEFEGERWEFFPGDAEWKETPLSVSIDIAGTDEPLVIPAGGHFVLVDMVEEEYGDNRAVFADLPGDGEQRNYLADPRISYLRNGGGQITLSLHRPGGGMTIMETKPKIWLEDPDNPDSAFKDADGAARGRSVQVTDPRPCWWRDGEEQTEPWSADAWQDLERSAQWHTDDDYWHWGSDNTINLGWFNRNWRDDTDDDASIGSGDGWYKLHAASLADAPDETQNLLKSFDLPLDNDSELFFNSPADLTYVHAGMPWCSLSPSSAWSGTEPEPGTLGAADIVFFRGLSRYLTGNSPYEYYDDETGQTGRIYAAGSGNEEYDRLGPPVRLHGRVNVNTAPLEVLKAVMAENVIRDEDKWDLTADRDEISNITEDIARAIIHERDEAYGGGPFESIDDFFDRVPEVLGARRDREDGWAGLGFGDDYAADRHEWGADFPNSPRRHAMARSLYNRITVRSDVWGVTARVQFCDLEEYSGRVNVYWDDGEDGWRVEPHGNEEFATWWDRVFIEGVRYDANVDYHRRLYLDDVPLQNLSYEYNGSTGTVAVYGNGFVAWESGDGFDTGWSGEITIGGTDYNISSVEPPGGLWLEESGEDLFFERLSYAGQTGVTPVNDRVLYLVIDRTFSEPRVLFRTELPIGR